MNVRRSTTPIEGYRTTLRDAVAAVVHEEPLETNGRVWREITGYRDLLDHVQQLTASPEFEWHFMLLNAMHFMLLNHNTGKSPGRFRQGAVYISGGRYLPPVYKGPDSERIPGLMLELDDWLNHGDLDASAYVRAAMAHLNLVSIHPWRDGNGRMSRAVHTLVLARNGVLPSEFTSVDEWLGERLHTYEYYAALNAVHGPTYQPSANTASWIRFCLRAHHFQAQRVERRVTDAARLWTELTDLAASLRLDERVVTVLFEIARGGRVRRTGYQRDEHLTLDQAVRDLRELARLGLLDQRGQASGRHYVTAPKLLERVQPITDPRNREPLREPYPS
jgi:Fic family protein